MARVYGALAYIRSRIKGITSSHSIPKSDAIFRFRVHQDFHESEKREAGKVLYFFRYLRVIKP